MSLTTRLSDGELVVVVYGRDRSRYDRYGENVSNWSTATADFRFDSEFDWKNPLEDVLVIPRPGQTVTEIRPFVLIEFLRSSSVTLNSVLFDGAEIADEFQILSDNEFAYWPEPMRLGAHTVRVKASDPAGNSGDFQFDFEVDSLPPFDLQLQPGWNAISFRATPGAPWLNHVFSEFAVETLVAYDASARGDSPWQMATRRNGHWEGNPNYGELSVVHAGKGYWVRASTNVRQLVRMRSSGYVVPDLPREPTRHRGWNFVGATDRGGRQYGEHFGNALTDSHLMPIFARNYLGNYDIAYTWDPVRAQFDELLPDEPVIIGDGIWVHYPDPER